jgi:hypothetical protein
MDSILQSIGPDAAQILIETLPRFKGKPSECSDETIRDIRENVCFRLQELDVDRLAARNGIHEDPIWDHLAGADMKAYSPLIVNHNYIVLDGFHRLSILFAKGYEKVICYVGQRHDY